MAINLQAFITPLGVQSTAPPRPPRTVVPGPLFEPAPIPETCPPGYQWDPVARQCVPTQPPTGPQTYLTCPTGYYWDANLMACIPNAGPGTGTGPGPGTGGVTGVTETGNVAAEGPIYVNVNNAVNVTDQSANNALRGVAGAVQQGITASAGVANQIAQDTATTISNQVSSLTGVLDQSITQAQNNIASVVSGINGDIANALSGLGTDVAQSIFNAINPVSTGLGAIIQIISQQIGGLAGAIGTAVGAVLPQIIAAITGAISPSTAVLQSIAGAVQNSTIALTQLGSDITGGFGTLDATLGRLLTSWETYNTGFVEAQTGYPDGGTLHHDLSALGAAIAGLVTSLENVASFTPLESLEPPCPSTTIQKILHTNTDFSKFGTSVWVNFWKIAVTAVVGLLKGLPALQKVSQLVGQDVNLECPNELLSSSALVEAVQRGFLTDADARQEAARGDLSNQRFQVLKDLAVHQMSPAELVEALYRGYIAQNDYQTALAAQGWTRGQQTILQGLAVPQIRPATYNSLNELLQRGIIDGPAFDKVLQGLNFDDAQRQALRQLVFRPQFQNEETEGLTAEDTFGSLGVSGVQQAPESVQTAGAAEGLDANAVNRRWLGHWSTGSVGLWIDLYFRGQATYQQLQAVLRRAFIPDQLHPSIVAGARPLIQFRTISRMVFLKLLTPSQGKAYLLQHGYSDADADTLINYALVSGKAPQAQIAKVQHGVSVGIAKEEYIDGSISAAQFYDVLIAHQFTPDGANTEIAVIDAHQAMLQRKANAQLVIDEYGAGLINEQVALAQLAALGLTVAELAKYAHKIRAFRVKNAKLPTEAELLKFAKANVITWDEYENGVLQLGYTQQTATWFLDLNRPSGGVTPPAAPIAQPAA